MQVNERSLMEPIVSIIIPFYNAEHTLEACLVSCLRQTLTSLEILLIDDGSTDKSYALAESYAHRFPEQLRLFRQENRGPSAARNHGIRLAKGRYIAFLDADDRLDRDMLLRMYLAAETDSADLVICGRYDVLHQKNGFHAVKRLPNAVHSGLSFFDAPSLLSETTQFVWDKLFRRDLLLTHDIFFQEDYRYTEDVLFLCIYKYYCNRIVIIPDPLCYHYLDERSPITKYGSRLLDVPKVMEDIFAFYRRKDAFRHPEVFFDLIAKRYLFRVERFPHMGEKRLQWTFCHRMQRVMKKHFPDWRSRIIRYHAHGFHGGVASCYRGSAVLMFLYIYLPNPLKQKLQKLTASLTKNRKKIQSRFSSLKQRILRYAGLFRNAFYRFSLTHGRLHDCNVLIQSKGGKLPAGNMFALLRESLQQKKHIVLALHPSYRNGWKNFCERYRIPTAAVQLVVPGSYRYLYHLATAGYLLNDSVFPRYFLKRKGQIYLNTWHGIPLKHMGVDVPGRAYAIGDVQRNFLHADYLLFPNDHMQNTMLHAYLPESLWQGTILHDAYPRVSVLCDNKRRCELRAALQLEDKRVCCYLPTWRGVMTKKENTQQYRDCLSHLQELDSLLDAGTVLYYKLHPYAEAGFQADDYQHILPFPEDYDTYDFLTVCDVLITDYSSVFFDFAATGRKIILFAYDYEKYRKQRGLYLTLSDLPFPLVTDIKTLHKEILSPKTYDDTDFLREYCPYNTENAAQRICQILFRNSRPAAEHLSPVCLLYGGLLAPGADFQHLMYLLTTHHTDRQTTYLPVIPAGALKKSQKQLERLLTTGMFLCLDTEFYYTPLEAFAYVLLVKKHCSIVSPLLKPFLDRLLQREYHRNFASLRFEKLLFCSKESERHRLLLQSVILAENTASTFERNSLT